MYKETIILLLLGAVVNALSGWGDCGSHLADVYRIRIAGCTQTPCTFVRGRSYLIEVDASSRTNSHRLPFATTAMILGVPITLLEGDACNHMSAGSCPALIGAGFTFSITYEVPALLPPINIVVTSVLWNDYGDVGICIYVPVILT